MKSVSERRVVVTGMGIVSCLGNRLDQVELALREGRSGLRHAPEYAELGFRSCVAGAPDVSREPPIPRKLRRYMGDVAVYAWHAMKQATDDARLMPASLSHPRVGLIVGSGTGSLIQHSAAIDLLRSRGIEKVPPYVVPQTMASTASACLATGLDIQGISYSVSSACATSSHCIGHASELIRHGQQDMVIAGGAEELGWTSTMAFDAMGALSTGYNDTPRKASRPFDAARDGFVIAGGGGVLILEALDHAVARGASIHAELIGYGTCSSSADMVSVNPEGPARAMRKALAEAAVSVDYINAHATGTPVGDLCEAQAIAKVFGEQTPLFSSTKGITGHPIAAAGVHESIYSILMLNRGFVAGSANLDRVDPAMDGMPVARQTMQRPLNAVMSNSFGFGGANVSLIFRRYQT